MKKKIKIIFYIHSLINFGGAERVLLTLLQNIDRSKFKIFLLMAKKEGKYIYEIPNDIITINMNLSKTVFAIPKIAFIIWRIKPDIFFSIRSLVIGFFSLPFKIFSPKTKFVVREVIIPSRHNKTETFPILHDFGYKVIYPLYDKIICQSDDMKNDLVKNYGIKGKNIIKIHNPAFGRNEFQINEIDRNIGFQAKGSIINLIAIGRLTYQKGFDLLINAFSLLDKNFYLTILGDGELESTLKNQAIEKRVNDRIHFVGFVEDTYKYISKSNIFVLSSRYEGLSNVLLEVMLCGLPVVAFNCPGGIKEIIKPKINGFIVPEENIVALADNILVASKTNFNKAKIISSVEHKFDLKDRVRDYEKFFSDLALNC